MSPAATLTKEAPDALRTPDGLLPPVSDVGRTQGRRQDDFTFKPSGRRATKRSSDHAPAPAPRWIASLSHSTRAKELASESELTRGAFSGNGLGNTVCPSTAPTVR
jgi:hypothetical protein